MEMTKATDIRKEWSAACDSVVRDKPLFIKRTRDRIWMSGMDVMTQILEAYDFNADLLHEKDGSITLSLREIDLIENGIDEIAARKALGDAILVYSDDYYNEFDMYSHTPNRKAHIPYIFKALIIGDGEEIGRQIICHDGKN